MNDVTDFQREVIEKSRSVPVLVDFWAPWCGPCRVLGPMLEKLAAEAAGRWVLAKLNTEEYPDLAETWRIASIPNVKLFVDGAVADEFVGALPEREVRRWLEHALPAPGRWQIAAARALLDRGRFQDAVTMLEALPAGDAAHADARLALAEARLHTDPGAVADTLHELEDDPMRGDRAGALRMLAQLVVRARRPEEFPEHPMRGRLLAGLDAVRAGDWGVALEALIEVLRADRGYGGGAARDAARAIFVLLGPGHPVVEQYHRAFSSALHA